jgi:hypothetical protein
VLGDESEVKTMIVSQDEVQDAPSSSSIFVPVAMDATSLNSNNLLNDSMATMVKHMNNAAAKPDRTTWLYTDGSGDPDNKDEWRIVEPNIKDPPEPPANTRLSDLQVFNMLNQDIKQTSKYTKWPVDFESRGASTRNVPHTAPLSTSTGIRGSTTTSYLENTIYSMVLRASHLNYG